MKIGGIIRGWYKKNKRDLPWRQTRDPYKIWLSEVILQQTRVNQGINYYLDFVESFPDVKTLALAPEDLVLKKWQGLGYYSRARNLHHAAKEILGEMGGHLPDSFEGLLKLKGVGNYTASAIASICYGEPRAVVDGNVSRVIARLYGIEEPVNSTAGGKAIDEVAMELLDESDPGNHNQAMMEFGAIQCAPSPNCDQCPLSASCEAYSRGIVDQLPVKIPKRKPVDRWMFFYIILCKGEIILNKRGTDDIWKGLYQFPLVELNESLSDKKLVDSIPDHLKMELGLDLSTNVLIKNISGPIRHQLTHRTIHARFIHLELISWPPDLPLEWKKISLDKVGDFPVPQLINRYMEEVKF